MSESDTPSISKYFKNAPDTPDFFSLGYKALSRIESKSDVHAVEPEKNDIRRLFKDITPAPTEAAKFFDSISTSPSTSGIFGDKDAIDHVAELSSSSFEKSFSKLRVSESGDRSRDAWIPPDNTRNVLVTIVTSPSGSYTVDKENLTMPGVVIEEDMKDIVYEVVNQYLGAQEAAKRKVLKANDVTQDDHGLRDLIAAGCYRAAINLTKPMLHIYGQGVGRSGYPSKHTVHSLQLWFTRLALLIKIGSYTFAEVESDPFGDLDKPDLYFQFYPEMYGGRTGSMVSFRFRLLLAQLPMYTGKHVLALNRLNRILVIVRKIIGNLNKGLLEDGTPCEISQTSKQEALAIWTGRESIILHSIVNCALAFKDYALALEVMHVLLKNVEKDSEAERTLNAAYGRILIQLGDVVAAEQVFKSIYDSRQPDINSLCDFGLLQVSKNLFKEALHYFEKAHQLDSSNTMILNNMSVCLLYLGRLKEAVTLVENNLMQNPKLALQEDSLLNLCNLYDLQSMESLAAKKRLLSYVNLYRGDSFNVTCLKLS